MAGLQVLLVLVAGLMLANPVQGLDNGLARTPAMGFNSWNVFGCDIQESTVRATADQLVELGLRDAGYVYLNVDDCWQSHERLYPSGRLQPDPQRFPSGMAALGQYAHDRGLKFGMYTDLGLFTCGGFPGSWRYEKVDADLFASWGVDYLKADNCYASDTDVLQRYITMRDALNQTGRPILFSMCSWGVGSPWQWGRNVSNSWRIDADINASWTSILRCIDSSIGLARFAGPGGWNDPDMLEVGVGDLSPGMERAHMAMWALLKAPLLIGADLTRIRKASLEILKAQEVIAINQDALGVAGDLVYAEGLLQVWAAPLEGGERAVVLLNRGGATPWLRAEIRVAWEALGLGTSTNAVVRDVFNRKDLGNFQGSFTGYVPGQDCLALRIRPIVTAGQAQAASAAMAREAVQQLEAWRPWHDSSAVQVQAQAASEARLRSSASVQEARLARLERVWATRARTASTGSSTGSRAANLRVAAAAAGGSDGRAIVIES